jgi:transcriptional regulator with XRE-family HTH domain
MSREQLGTTLKRIRKSKRLSQYAVAKKTGLSREYIRQLEEGQSDPTVGTLRRLAVALDVSLVALVEGWEVLEALVGAAVGAAEGDSALAMRGLVRELSSRPGLILGSLRELRALGEESRRRTPELVEEALRLTSALSPWSAFPMGDPRRRTITSLAQGLTDLVERADRKSRHPHMRRR